MNSLEEELLAVVPTTQRDADRQKQLKCYLSALEKLPTDEWEKLSGELRTWYNISAWIYNRSSTGKVPKRWALIPDFDDAHPREIPIEVKAQP